MTFLRYAIFQILLVIVCASAQADALQCSLLFSQQKISNSTSDQIKSLEITLKKSVLTLAKKTHEYNSLPELPNPYSMSEYANYPRAKWLKNNSKAPQRRYYNRIYQLELAAAAAKKTDSKKAEALYLELANLYLIGQYSEAAVISAMRAERSDLAEWIATSIGYVLPSTEHQASQRLHKLTEDFQDFRDRPEYLKKREIDQLKTAEETHWSELEIEALKLKRSSHPQKQQASKIIYQKLAEDYLKNLMYQEAIWSFRAAENFEKANELQDYLNQVLLNNPLMITDKKVGGVTQSKIYELAPGIRVIAKTRSGIRTGNQKPSDEFLAYQISEVLGMNRVTTTVLRNIEGRETSLQVLVRPNEAHSSRWLDRMEKESEMTRSEMDVFDYLIVNQDRYNEMGPHNQVIRFGGQRVLIDHGISFRPYLIMKHLPFLKYLYQNKDVINDTHYNLATRLPTPEFIKALEDLDRPEQNKKLKNLFWASSLSLRYQIFEQRRKLVLAEIKKIKQQNSETNNF